MSCIPRGLPRQLLRILSRFRFFSRQFLLLSRHGRFHEQYQVIEARFHCVSRQPRARAEENFVLRWRPVHHLRTLAHFLRQSVGPQVLDRDVTHLLRASPDASP